MNGKINGSKREIGIEILRIVSMFMVVILHVLGQGGILANSSGINYKIILYLEILAYAAVNTFALISGYVGLNSKFRYHKILTLYLQAIFYSIGITIVAYLAGFGVDLGLWCKSILPFTCKMWWYISAYFCVYFFMPILNNAIHNVSRKQIRMFFIAISIICLILPQIFNRNPYIFNSGYSVIWLIVLYLFGAYLKKYNVLKNISKIKSFIIFILSSTFSWFCILIVNTSNFKYIGTNLLVTDTFMSYLSIFIIINAVMLVSLFTKIEIKNRKIYKIISIISSASLGVYLIHVHAIPWSMLSNRFIKYISFPPLKLLLYSLSIAVVIYLACTVIELVRILIFKIFKVKKICKIIDRKFSKYLYEE